MSRCWSSGSSSIAHQNAVDADIVAGPLVPSLHQFVSDRAATLTLEPRRQATGGNRLSDSGVNSSYEKIIWLYHIGGIQTSRRRATTVIG